MNSKEGRRSFITKMAMGGILAMGLPEISLAGTDAKSKKISLRPNDVILFQGDSITDAGRLRTELSANNQKALGSGYAFLAAAKLLKKYPSENLQIYNRGISGNKVYQLADRWEQDALNLKPTIVSILIGVNDYWHMRKNGYKGTVETYRKDLSALLERTKDKLPEVKLVIGQPFILEGTSVDKSWFDAFRPYQETAEDIAEQHNAILIPYQKKFNEALKTAPASYWIPDGVHPSIAGAELMAEAWLSAIR